MKTTETQSVPRRRPGDVDRRVGCRLRLRRTMLGLSQTKLADLCSVSSQQIHKYEIGLSALRASRLAQLGAILGVPVSWFFDGIEDNPNLPDDLVEILGKPDVMQILTGYTALQSHAHRKSVVAMIKALRVHEKTVDEEEELAQGVLAVQQ